MHTMKKIKAALIQSSPILFDLEATLNKVEQLARKASDQSPDLIVFPEAFIPAYPRGLSFGTVVGSRSEEGRETWLKYFDNCISVPSAESDRLGNIAKEVNTHLVIGVVEKGDTGTLYCTMLYYNPKGELIGKHRKLKPTAAERIIWGEGNGQDMDVHQSSIGKMGGLICWENYMPLARTHLYSQGIELYIAPTADMRDSWQATMRHIATEGRCFVLGCNQFVRKEEYPVLPGEDYSNFPDIMSRGGSVVVDPLGNVIAGPVFDEEAILTAELDMNMISKAKMDFDPVGHYARNDVFELRKLP